MDHEWVVTIYIPSTHYIHHQTGLHLFQPNPAISRANRYISIADHQKYKHTSNYTALTQPHTTSTPSLASTRGGQDHIKGYHHPYDQVEPHIVINFLSYGVVHACFTLSCPIELSDLWDIYNHAIIPQPSLFLSTQQTT